MKSTNWTRLAVAAALAVIGVSKASAQDYDIGVNGPIYSWSPPSNRFADGTPYMNFVPRTSGSTAAPRAITALTFSPVPGTAQVRVTKGNPTPQMIQVLRFTIERSNYQVFANNTINWGGLMGTTAAQGQNAVFTAQGSGGAAIGTVASAGIPGVVRMTVVFGSGTNAVMATVNLKLTQVN